MSKIIEYKSEIVLFDILAENAILIYDGRSLILGVSLTKK